MRNIIGAKHVITPDIWALSFVRRSGQDHCFLILEGVDHNNDLILKRIDFGYKEIQPIKYEGTKKIQDAKFDVTYGQVYDRDISMAQLEKLGTNCIYKSWEITKDEKEKLDRWIKDYQKLENIKYNLAGKAKVGGMFGASLDVSHLQETKQASIDAAEASAKKGSSLGQVALAVLREGHNCTSWAIEAIRQIRPSFDEAHIIAKFVVIPQVELPSTKCGIM